MIRIFHHKKKLTDKALAALYTKWKGSWLLLKVLEKNPETGKGKKFLLIARAKDKTEILNFLDRDDWQWDGEYIIVYADPTKLCKL